MPYWTGTYKYIYMYIYIYILDPAIQNISIYVSNYGLYSDLHISRYITYKSYLPLLEEELNDITKECADSDKDLKKELKEAYPATLNLFCKADCPCKSSNPLNLP